MGLFDNLLKSVSGMNNTKGTDQNTLTSIVDLLNNHQGGVEGVLGELKQGGLENIVDSWIGTGKNKSVKASQIKNILGSDQIKQLAAKLNISPNAASGKLSQLLPLIIDKITPQGNASTLSKGINIQEVLGSLMKKN